MILVVNCGSTSIKASIIDPPSGDCCAALQVATRWLATGPVPAAANKRQCHGGGCRGERRRGG